MKHSIDKKYFYQFLIVILPLLIGLCIYVIGRKTSINLDSFLEISSYRHYQFSLPSIVVYSLPDGLCAFSIMLALNLIWKWKVPFFWEFVLVSFLIFSELLQMNYISGTFDSFDLISICTGIIIIQIYSLFFNFKRTEYAN